MPAPSQRPDRRERAVAARRLTFDGIAQPLTFPESLPITVRRDELVSAIRDNQVIIVAGETGSGKSTQIPKLCLEAGRGIEGMIGHTQPRRVAARTVAERIAEELGTPISGGVGYTVRFNDRVSDGTLVRVMTDGILLNELQRDRSLRRYDTIIIDEAHERSLNIDFILGYLKQLLPRRPDLKVIVTSATIDTERFAAHFGIDGEPAPVFLVEGRTFPVELRYRPYGRDADSQDARHDHRDQVTAVLDAIDELERAGPGDVLVFLSGEREIHDVANALKIAELKGTEVMPLYGRLSSAEQHRIFQSHRGRRIVLSTNVAETSITVPGVRYVVDAGTARVSRYSRRLKVQRLPIEPVSQASANQRAGRCGRVAAGICIRLYSSDDYDARPEFTDPEILRTSLASVILQMTSIGLGNVAQFPFVEPPDHASIKDGYLLLDELGAIEPGRTGSVRDLTEIGRQLARLPIDPRLARMVVEADRHGCVREVLVIASALSIQDVRERPNESPEQAAELHRRFDVAGSDFLSIVALWDYLRDRQRELSGNRFRRLCRDEHLNYVRVREWRDLYSQLRQVAGRLGIRPGIDEAHSDHVHRALLAGLLSQIGYREGEGRQFRGARNIEFVVAPGSVLSNKPSRWIVAAELVETNRLWARRVATIQPEWAEPLADHLVKRSYTEPEWDSKAGRAVTRESVLLYGLPIVTARVIGLDRIDRELAREMFVRNALIAGAWDTRHGFVDRNRRFVERVGLLEARVRRRDLLDDDSLVAFYDEHVGREVTSGRHFDRWWKNASAEDPEGLDLTASVLTNRGGISLSDYPDTWTQGELELPITYRYEPGAPLDGASLSVPLTALNQLTMEGLDWLVPGFRRELVASMVRSLPKDVRRELIPMTETADAIFDRLGPPEGSLQSALVRAVADVRGVHVRESDFDDSTLATNLRMHFVVIDAVGTVVDASDDLDSLRDRQAGNARSALALASPVSERRGITRWDLGNLERVVEHTVESGATVRSYPTLLDRGDSVALRVVDNEGLQARAMRGGVRRLLLMTGAPTSTKIERSLDQPGRLAIARIQLDLNDLTAECIETAVDSVMTRFDLPWGESEFGALERVVRSDTAQIAADALGVAADIAGAAGRVRKRLGSLTSDSLVPTVADANAHLDRLVCPGFVRRAGAHRLPDVHRYVRGIEYRLDHLAGDVQRDQRRMAEVRPVERDYRTAADRLDRASDDVIDVAWMLEELRMSTFAQAMGVIGPVSAPRIRREFERATGSRLR
jgi:ATP-dependent helicase HrpA